MIVFLLGIAAGGHLQLAPMHYTTSRSHDDGATYGMDIRRIDDAIGNEKFQTTLLAGGKCHLVN